MFRCLNRWHEAMAIRLGVGVCAFREQMIKSVKGCKTPA
jgi:hypothetical protein